MENIKRYYPAIIVTAILLVVAAAGMFLVHNNLRTAARQQFVGSVNARIGDIENDIRNDKSDGQSIAQSFLISTQQGTTSQADYQPRLKLLYDNIARRDDDLVMVGVARRVAGTERTAYERAAAAELNRPLTITSMGPGGDMSDDIERDAYFPIAFIEPKEIADPHVGMNIGSDPVISKAMVQAAETGFPAISGTLIIHKGDSDINGYCVIVPITMGQTSSAQIIGYVIQYDSYDALVGELSRNGEDFSGLAIFDSAAPTPTMPVAKTGSAFDNAVHLSDLVADRSNYFKTIELKNHSWTLVAIPNPAEPSQIWLLIGIGAANVAFIVLIGMYMFSSIHRSLALEAVEADLRLSYGELSSWAEKSEKRTVELTMLREMSDMLQTCDNTSEAFLVMSLFMYKLFKPHNGGVYILSKDRAIAEIKVAWGKNSPEEKTFKFTDCVALRRADSYKVEDTAAGLICSHANNPAPSAYICLPMMAQGDTFGLFYLSDSGPDGTPLEREDYVLATTVAEQLGMTLSNINLREKLKEQSLTDHLTKLFNRRYMEDMLEREIRRADRNKQKIGFIMFDIDFFKDINDTYGHDAGDRVLETLGIFLKTSVRAEDIACRYGGEEFLLVMPGNDRANTVKRANEIIERVQLLAIETDGQVMPPIHLSGGVSIYPDDSADKGQIVVKADEALYEAKRTGRNKIVEWAAVKK